MTYRDDTDAAIARADALADDLKRAEDERDQLRAEVEQLKRERDGVIAEPEPVAIAVVPEPEIPDAALIELVEEGLTKTHNDRTSSVVFGLIMSVAGIAVTAFGFGIGMFLIGIGVAAVLLAVQQFGRDNSELVLDAVKTNPTSITAMRVEPRGLRISVGDRSELCWTPQPTVIGERLARYCSNPKLLQDGEQDLP
ncbi:MAG: hypothetical protein QM831_27880 [Kofleriaceae bacterium]